KFTDDPLYHQDDAEAAIEMIASQEEIAPQVRPEDWRVPRDLPPYLQELYRVPLLTPAGERALFLKFNFHKYRFVCARRKLEPQMLGARRATSMDEEALAAVPDPRPATGGERLADGEAVRVLLSRSRLDDRERGVVLAHYGLGRDTAATYEQLGRRLGLSKQRVRQIEKAALAKLRRAAESLRL